VNDNMKKGMKGNKFIIFSSIIILLVFAAGFAIGVTNTNTPLVSHDASTIIFGNTNLGAFMVTSILDSLSLRAQINSQNDNMKKLAEIVGRETGKNQINTQFLDHLGALRFVGYGKRSYLQARDGDDFYVVLSVESNANNVDCAVKTKRNPGLSIAGEGYQMINADGYTNKVITDNPGWYLHSDDWDIDEFRREIEFIGVEPQSDNADDKTYYVKIRCRARGGEWKSVQEVPVRWIGA